MEMYIVLAVTLFMMIMFIWHKVPFGVTTMTCCIILAAAGIFDVKTAFSGFGNQIVVLIAPMLALSAVLGKTSLVAKISSLMDIMKNKREILLVFTIYIVGAILAQFYSLHGSAHHHGGVPDHSGKYGRYHHKENHPSPSGCARAHGSSASPSEWELQPSQP